jgi:hypothetical protein
VAISTVAVNSLAGCNPNATPVLHTYRICGFTLSADQHILSRGQASNLCRVRTPLKLGSWLLAPTRTQFNSRAVVAARIVALQPCATPRRIQAQVAWKRRSLPTDRAAARYAKIQAAHRDLAVHRPPQSTSERPLSEAPAVPEGMYFVSPHPSNLAQQALEPA